MSGSAGRLKVPENTVERTCIGGPLDRTSIRVNLRAAEVNIGWLTAWYQLGTDDTYYWVSLANPMCGKCQRNLTRKFRDVPKPEGQSTKRVLSWYCVNPECEQHFVEDFFKGHFEAATPPTSGLLGLDGKPIEENKGRMILLP